MSSFHRVVVGKSVRNKELWVAVNFNWQFPPPDGLTLILGGVHGNEPATVKLVTRFLESQDGTLTSPVMILPMVNPDGFELGIRYNANGTDLNRNCELYWSAQSEEPPGPSAWSEPENQILRKLVMEWRPRKIVTLHWALGELDADGVQSLPLLDAMWEALPGNGQKPYRRIFTTKVNPESCLPGSFGTWCGFAVQYPDGSRPSIVTLELPHDPRHVRSDHLPDDHLEQLQQTWSSDADGYLDAVYPGVEKMLLAACRLKV